MGYEIKLQNLHHPLPIERPAFAGFFVSSAKTLDIKFKLLKTVTLLLT
jgi:hypothetical protein